MKAAFGDQRFDALIEIRYRHGVCMSDEYTDKAYDDHLPQIDHCFRAFWWANSRSIHKGRQDGLQRRHFWIDNSFFLRHLAKVSRRYDDTKIKNVVDLKR